MEDMEDKNKKKKKDEGWLKEGLKGAGISTAGGPAGMALTAAIKFASKQRKKSKERQKELIAAGNKQQTNMLSSAYKTAGLMQNLRPIA